jgi:endonuclease/exonuclease/phosphatase (EEP) superfamily protein YafD
MGAVAVLIQLYHIARFSPFWRRRAADYDGSGDEVSKIRLLVSNVKQGNDDHQSLCDLVARIDPDIALFMETDGGWVAALNRAVQDYPYRLECPLDNSYGMFLVSRFKLAEKRVRFLLNDEVPSFHCEVEVSDGPCFRLIAVHPEPPLPHRDTEARDAEIAVVGEIVRDERMPVIVAGDLNDVAWSRTTRRFLRLSRLLDPREGRGQFNTFHASYFFLRWPLDHVFVSDHFRIISMERMPSIGSDHFPMSCVLALSNEPAARRPADEADEQDKDEARRLIEAERQRDRRPVGTDWEE